MNIKQRCGKAETWKESILAMILNRKKKQSLCQSFEPKQMWIYNRVWY